MASSTVHTLKRLKRWRWRIGVLTLVLLLGDGALGQRAALASNPCNIPGPAAWQVYANGTGGELQIFTTTCQNGRFSGSIQFSAPPAAAEPIQGFWDDSDQKLMFYRTPTADLQSAQVFTGYYFHDRGLDDDWLTGSFEAFPNAGGSGPHQLFGWFAHTPFPDRPGHFDFGGQGLGVAAFPGFASVSMIANGFDLRLTVTYVDVDNHLHGEISDGVSSTPINGFFDHDQQKVTFLRQLDPNDASTLQLFTGYILATQSSSDPSTVIMNIAGSFEAFSGSGATASRSVYGWALANVRFPAISGGSGF